MSELRERCLEMADKIIEEGFVEVSTLEAFAKEQQIKGMEAAAHDLLNRMRQAKESGPCTIQAVRGVTVDHMGWIEDQIAKLKEGG